MHQTPTRICLSFCYSTRYGLLLQVVSTRSPIVIDQYFIPPKMFSYSYCVVTYYEICIHQLLRVNVSVRRQIMQNDTGPMVSTSRFSKRDKVHAQEGNHNKVNGITFLFRCTIDNPIQQRQYVAWEPEFDMQATSRSIVFHQFPSFVRIETC